MKFLLQNAYVMIKMCKICACAVTLKHLRFIICASYMIKI